MDKMTMTRDLSPHAPNVGSQNYAGRYYTKCSTCEGNGYNLAMNCYNCSNGQANCNTCGGDRKDEL